MANTTVNLENFGHANVVAVTGNKTLALSDQGIVQNVTASSTVTLPAAAAGQTAVVRVGAEGITVSVLPAGTDTMTGNGFTPAGAKGAVFTSAPAGSYIQLVSGAATWHIAKLLGTATRTP
jgi:hypothetical protein